MLVGGGQDAADVTTTSDRAGGFQSRFFHKVLSQGSLVPIACCSLSSACDLESGSLGVLGAILVPGHPPRLQ